MFVVLNRRALAVIGIVAVAAVVATVAIVIRNGISTAVEVLGGQAAYDAISRPDKVEAYRLDPPSPAPQLPSQYPVTAGPVRLSPDMAAEVSASLTSSATYLLDSAKSCNPRYGVKLSFHRGAERIDVLLCYECMIFTAVRGDQFIGGEDFDNGNATLVRAAKAAFPDDEAIQGLQE